MLVLILNVLMIFYLQYLNILYTSISQNQRTSDLILDLVFTNEEGMVTNLIYLPPLGNSDHACLKFDFNVISNNKHTRSCYKLS